MSERKRMRRATSSLYSFRLSLAHVRAHYNSGSNIRHSCYQCCINMHERKALWDISIAGNCGKFKQQRVVMHEHENTLPKQTRGSNVFIIIKLMCYTTHREKVIGKLSSPVGLHQRTREDGGRGQYPIPIFRIRRILCM